MKNLLICGSRNQNEDAAIFSGMYNIITQYGFPQKILHGGAKGGDELAQRWAKLYKIETEIIRPNYQAHGRHAPLKRNTELVRKADLVLALYGKGKDRKGGTWDTVQKAIKANKIVLELFADGRLKWTQPAAQLF